MRRVVQFSTGNVGRHSLKAIVGRPDLELVGVHAASPNKIGRDAAELCGLNEATGVIATDDIDALIALKPIALCTPHRPKRGRWKPSSSCRSFSPRVSTSWGARWCGS